MRRPCVSSRRGDDGWRPGHCWRSASPARRFSSRAPGRILAAASSTARWLVELVVTAGVGLGAAGAALTLAVPGRERGAATRWLPVAALALWTGILLQALFAAGGPWAQLTAEPAYLACLFKSVLVGAVPAIAMLAMVRQAAPIRLGWTAGLGALAAFGIGAAAAQVLCPIDRPAHLILWHLLPVVGLSGLAALGARRLLGWNHPRS